MIMRLLAIICMISISSVPANAFWFGGGGSGAGVPGGTNTQVQYNDAGTFSGHSGLTYDAATAKLTVGYISGGYAGSLINNGGGAWVNGSNITITSSTNALTAGYVLRVISTTTTTLTSTYIYEHSLSSGNDFRVEYYNGTSWVEINRRIVEYATNSIKVDIALQSQIATSTVDSTHYRLRFNNLSSGLPPANNATIYLFWDDFSGDLSKWHVNAGDAGETAAIEAGYIHVHETAGANRKTLQSIVSVTGDVDVNWIGKMTVQDGYYPGVGMTDGDRTMACQGAYPAFVPEKKFHVSKLVNGVVDWGIQNIGSWALDVDVNMSIRHYSGSYYIHQNGAQIGSQAYTMGAQKYIILADVWNRPLADPGGDFWVNSVFVRPVVATDSNILVACSAAQPLGVAIEGLICPGLSTYADNAAAITGGLTAGKMYRTATGVTMTVY